MAYGYVSINLHRNTLYDDIWWLYNDINNNIRVIIVVEIRLDEKWIMKSDEKQWILGYNTFNKDSVTFNAKYFFIDLVCCAKFYLDLKLKCSQAKDFKELADNLTKIRRSIDLAISPIKNLHLV